jgi:hypothetical protein
MNERIRELANKAGGEFWQRVESDGVLNEEAYITFDPPQSLEKFTELIVKECANMCYKASQESFRVNEVKAGAMGMLLKVLMEEHFGVEE